jgi:hypothetical protein
MKTFNELMVRREAEREAYEEKMMAKWEADWEKRKGYFEKMTVMLIANHGERKAEGKTTNNMCRKGWKPFMSR